MKQFALFVTALLLAVVVCAQDFPAKPNPPRLVNDYVNFLTTDQRASLERKLVDYYDSTSNEIAIVVLESIGNNDPGDYATELGRRWGVGGKEFNNGVVILITVGGGAGRRHVFIAPGYGLEKRIPDYTAKQIVDDDLIPYLKQQDYYRALNNSVDAIMRAAAGEYKATAKKDNGRGPSPFLIFIVIIIIIIAISRKGGGRGGMMSRRGYRGSSVPPIWWWPSAGSSGGGGWSSGGGGGGSFGGFGGGSFGGGGAGGSW
ncbi:MAG TPA: TPM domain-containing protein [Chitinophagaceae bacterium]